MVRHFTLIVSHCRVSRGIDRWGIWIGFSLVILSGCMSERGDQSADPRSGSSGARVGASPLSLTEQAVDQHQNGNWREADRLVQQALIQDPGDLLALQLAVELSANQSNFGRAAELAERVAEIDPVNAPKILVNAFDWRIKVGDFSAAEANLRNGLRLEPENVGINRLLAQLLNAQGRRYEASQYVRELIRLRAVTPIEILSLVDLSGPFYLASFDEFEKEGEVTLLQLGKARERYTKFNLPPDQILEQIQRIRSAFPQSIAAAAFHGRVLSETARFDELPDWFNQVPEGIAGHPEYWSAIGNWLVHIGEADASIRAFGEAVRLDPTDRESLRQMMQVLARQGNDSKVAHIRDNLVVLDRIFRIAKDAKHEEKLWIAEQLRRLARPWESVGWLIYDAQQMGDLRERIPQIRLRAEAIEQWERAGSEHQIRQARLTRLIGFSVSEIELPDVNGLRLPVESSSPMENREKLRFTDVAKQCGIDMTFQSGFPKDGKGFYPYQVNGGGIAVSDFDLDGCNDLYFANAGNDPREDKGSQPNRLFRSEADEQFVDVSRLAGVDSQGFGQGVAAGDLNQDGFQDLVVGNIGRNEVYLNQGDGTFVDVSDSLESLADSWTSCVGIADINGDMLPEVIEVNYIDDERSFDARCDEGYLECQPQRFLAAADQVFLNQGDGQFLPWEGFPRGDETRQHGFGLVIANFDNEYGNDFFVANDGDLNHFWISGPSSKKELGPYQLTESASLRGCSIGRGGDSQACMGVAHADLDRDGTLDLLVTNFHHEPVNLFLQTSSGYFADEAVKYGLFEPTFSVLGFGTQAADFNNDGWMDLAALSGHVFNATDEGIPFRMKPQLFCGAASGFTLQEAKQIGHYWQQEQLGRTLATLDLHRDGKIDLVSSHLDRPMALLRNESSAERWLQLELFGVDSERDAIGAVAHVRCGTQQWHAWQTAGDGYMCSNEPVLHFGLGAFEHVDELTIDWPSGKSQRFTQLDVGQRYFVVEGVDEIQQRQKLSGN